MLNKKSFLQYFITLAVGTLWHVTACAVDFLSLTANVAPPNTILIGSETAIEYVVKNNTTFNLQVSDRSLPSGAISQTGAGYCDNPTVLHPRDHAGSSCIARYKFFAPNTPTQIIAQVKKHIDGTDQTAVGNLFNIQVVGKPIASMPTLSIDDNTIYLPPGVSQYIHIKNESNTAVANNVQIILPQNVANKVNPITGCLSIAPHATCQIEVTAKPDAVPSSEPIPITIQGSNTYPLMAQFMVLETSGVVGNGINFTTPGVQSLRLTNTASNPVKIDLITFSPTLKKAVKNKSIASAVSNITIGDYSHCSAIPGHGGTCDVPITATTNSYGSGSIYIHYTLQTFPDVTTATINVADTQLAFYDNNDNPIVGNELKVEKEISPQIFKVKNTGNFNWQGANVNWLNTPLSGVMKDQDICSGSLLAPNAVCNFRLTTDSSAKPGSSKILTATGFNIATSGADNNVIVRGGLAITPELNSAYKHLQYRAIKIENMTDYDATVDNVIVSSGLSPDKIKLCSPADADCDYKTDLTCDTPGSVLPSHNACLIWFKAKHNDLFNLGSINGTIDITATYSWPNSLNAQNLLPITETDTFNVVYDQSLYAGGSFTAAGGNASNYIAKWNGTNWSTLGSGLASVASGSVYSSTEYKGDLYVGGWLKVGATNNNLAKWDGGNWSLLSQSLPLPGTNIVHALAVYQGSLYAGGQFYWNIQTAPNPTTYYTKGKVGSWDGDPTHPWTPIGGSAMNGVRGEVTPTVYGLKVFNNLLHVVGYFDFAPASSSTRVGGVATWNGSNWGQFGSGVIGASTYKPVIAEEFLNGTLYVGGSYFTYPTFTSIAKWVGSWAKLNTRINGGFDGNKFIYSLAGSDSTSSLYMGGNFNTVYQTDGTNPNTNYIARWNALTSTWASLPEGFVSGANGVLYSTPASTVVYSILVLGNDMYVGGVFTQALGGIGSPVSASGIAKWNGSNWSPLGTGLTGGTAPTQVRSLIIAPALSISD